MQPRDMLPANLHNWDENIRRWKHLWEFQACKTGVCLAGMVAPALP